MNRPAHRRLLQSGCPAAWARGSHRFPSRFVPVSHGWLCHCLCNITELIISVSADLSTVSSGNSLCFLFFHRPASSLSSPFAAGHNFTLVFSKKWCYTVPNETTRGELFELLGTSENCEPSPGIGSEILLPTGPVLAGYDP